MHVVGDGYPTLLDAAWSPTQGGRLEGYTWLPCVDHLVKPISAPSNNEQRQVVRLGRSCYDYKKFS